MLKRSPYSLDIQLVEVLARMLNAYEQIYVVKMQKIRQYVLTNRVYMEGVSEVFGELKWSYKDKVETESQLEGSARKVDIATLSLLQKNGKSVAVLLTAKAKWAGEINRKVFSRFMAYIRERDDVDIAIIGSVGREYYKRTGVQRPFKYFDLSEEQVSVQELTPVINYILSYEQVMLFYGKFINLVKQVEVSADIRGGEEFTEDEEERKKKKRKILFEPTLEELLVFFETQIFASLYKQLSHESYLAQIGSRINNLRQANENIQERLKELRFKQWKFIKSQKNKKQRQALSGMMLWNV